MWKEIKNYCETDIIKILHDDIKTCLSILWVKNTVNIGVCGFIGSIIIHYVAIIDWSNLNNVAKVVSGIIASTGLYYLIVKTKVLQQQAETALKQTEIAMKQAETAANKRLDDRFKDAVTLLGNSHRSVRTGGIYALDEIAKSEQEIKHSPYPPKRIAEILCGFIRSQSVDDWRQFQETVEPRDKTAPKSFKVQDDVQTALNQLVLPLYEGIVLDLSFSQLQGAQLRDADLRGVNLRGADLREAHLSRADLRGAYLTSANLKGAQLINAKLNGAKLKDANLSDTNLIDVNLIDAYLADANLSGAHLIGADLSDANLSDAKLNRAKLNRANLSRANLTSAELTNADLKGAQLNYAVLIAAHLTDALFNQTCLEEDYIVTAPLTDSDRSYLKSRGAV